jgi:hypothetical protein
MNLPVSDSLKTIIQMNDVVDYPAMFDTILTLSKLQAGWGC